MSAPSPAESTPLNHQSTTNCSAVSNGGGIFSKYPVAPNMFTSASSMMAASNGNPFGISFINGLGGGFGSRNSTSSPPKSKRCRQRVDAGEPRHFYQQQQQQQQVILFESWRVLIKGKLNPLKLKYPRNSGKLVSISRSQIITWC